MTAFENDFDIAFVQPTDTPSKKFKKVSALLHIVVGLQSRTMLTVD
jgi:hypothetical protein